MKNAFESFLISIGVIALLGLISIISGTILYLIWTTAITAAFPGLVESGTIAAELTWWQSVCLSWLFGILFKSVQTKK